ncbi:hypothetical protein SAMN06265827_10598 [Orenia metallireducens]|uniref:Uncharacterized protein n=1 Tax=Orenia metallireducens TaxID=1413210 RepID=A0A285GA72_9FIRM|nr:hypothetical protein [Orenia metallireducens]SNY19311.1 hypothetical protein SAMN06265827_10598 [Orenia metallireducens]
MKIELKPCYPIGTILCEQLEKLQEEWVEIIESDSWENLASEFLDLAQVSTGVAGLYDIEKVSISLDEIKTTILEHQNGFADLYEALCTLHGVVVWTGCYKNAIELAKISICCFYDLICEHDRGCKKYRQKLLDRFLDEHQAKLESRKKEWAVHDSSDNR